MTKTFTSLALAVALLVAVLAAPADAANYSCWRFYNGSGWNGYGSASFSESGGRLHAHTITIGTTRSCNASNAQPSDLIAYAWIDRWTGSSWQRVATHVDSDHDGAAWAYASATASPGIYRIAAFHTLFVQGVPRNGWRGYQYYTT